MLRYSNTSCVFPRLQWSRTPEKWFLFFSQKFAHEGQISPVITTWMSQICSNSICPTLDSLVSCPSPKSKDWHCCLHSLPSGNLGVIFLQSFLLPNAQSVTKYCKYVKIFFYSTIHFFLYQLFLISDPCHSLLHGHLQNFCKAPFPLTSLHSAIRRIQVVCQIEVHTLH